MRGTRTSRDGSGCRAAIDVVRQAFAAMEAGDTAAASAAFARARHLLVERSFHLAS